MAGDILRIKAKCALLLQSLLYETFLHITSTKADQSKGQPK
jgi:hypothetical protein